MGKKIQCSSYNSVAFSFPLVMLPFLPVISLQRLGLGWSLITMVKLLRKHIFHDHKERLWTYSSCFILCPCGIRNFKETLKRYVRSEIIISKDCHRSTYLLLILHWELYSVLWEYIDFCQTICACLV